MNDLEKHVLQLIGESVISPDAFSDITPIRDSINAAIQELCMVTGSYTSIYHLPLMAERHFYRMKWQQDFFGYVVECWNRRRRWKLEQIDILSLSMKDPWFLKRAGSPDRYFHIGVQCIGFDRAPSSAGEVLEIKCVAIPKFYTDDVSPVKIRTVFQQATIYYACSEFYAGRGDAVRAQEYMAKYLETASIMQLSPAQAERVWSIGQNAARFDSAVKGPYTNL